MVWWGSQPPGIVRPAPVAGIRVLWRSRANRRIARYHQLKNRWMKPGREGPIIGIGGGGPLGIAIGGGAPLGIAIGAGTPFGIAIGGAPLGITMGGGTGGRPFRVTDRLKELPEKL